MSRVSPERPSPGAVPIGEGRCRFSVWAPRIERVDLHLIEPADRLVPLARDETGTHTAEVEAVPEGSLYMFRLDDGRERPDPASRRQPRGVHGPSAVVAASPGPDSAARFACPDAQDHVFYEIHTGTFTRDGTLAAIVPHLDALKDLGVTTVELMPLSPFPGERNWGYDGVYPFAVQESYGGPDGLRHLAGACHSRGLALALDVVYNHLGPEGNYLGEFGPYFTDRYRTPWGTALNFDGPHSDEVRRYFIESALYFLTAFHVDVFRVDAVHAIVDPSARPFLQELVSALHARAAELGRRVLVVAESNLNDVRVIASEEMSGWGFDAQWSDDFHHALHTLLTGERSGYYEDFGRLEDLSAAFRDGFVYAGRYSPYRKRRHGNEPRGCDGSRFVVSAQNHDQVGNRARGERLSTLVDFGRLKLAATAVILSPYLPLLFMGEEYGETAPFLFFTSYSDPELREAVRHGRRAEFAAFGWREEEIPDPEDIATFERSRLDRRLLDNPRHRALLDLHRELLRLRRAIPALRSTDRERLTAVPSSASGTLVVQRSAGASQAILVLAFGEGAARSGVPLPVGRWVRLADTEDPRWMGSGLQTEASLASDGGVGVRITGGSAIVFQREEATGGARA